MREVKFRGLYKDKWVYGYLIPSSMIQDPDELCPLWIATGFEDECYPVAPDSVGQYTGLKDKNGKEIYEGDVDSEGIFIVWRKDLASFALRRKGWMYDHFFGEAKHPDKFEIIGNTYDNEGLLTLKSES